MKNVDFDQVNDFSIAPVYKIALTYFTINQSNFLDNTIEISSVADISSFNLLKSKFVRENLLQLDVDFKINNQFDRDFRIQIQFLDDVDNITHSFSPFVIQALDDDYAKTEKISIAGNQQFLSSTKLKVIIELSPSNNGSTLDPNDLKTLNFKSGATVYLKI